MRQKIKLIHLLQWTFVSALLLLAGSLCIFQLYSNYHQFEKRAQKIRTNFIDHQKDLIKREIERVVEHINYKRKTTASLAKERLMGRVYEAYAIAENIYQQNKNLKKKNELIQLIKNALRPIRFNNNNSCYFIFNSQGKNILCADNHSLEGSNFLKKPDRSGQNIIREMLRIADLHNEGFYHYYCTKPGTGTSGGKYRKISFIKRFAALDLIIGSGVYFSDIEKNLQHELLEDIAKIRFGQQKNGYIFVVSYTGTTLMNDTMRQLIGKNIWNLTDPNGIKVIQEERKAVNNPDGAFIQYSWNKPSAGKISPKISFIKGINDWQWMIGAGVYLDDCETEIVRLRKELLQNRKQVILNITAITIILILISLLILTFIAHYINCDYKVFINFFNHSASSNEELDRNELKFREFDELSAYANQMLRKKIESQHKLEDEHEHLQVTLQSIGDAVVTTDTKGEVLLLNPIAEKLTGWQQGSAISQPIDTIFKIVDKTTRKPQTSPVNQAIETKEIVTLANHTLLLSKDGKEYDIEDSAAPIRNNHREIIGVVLVFRDVTAKLKSEQELLRSRQLESIGTLAGGIAHDFNNLLTGIFGNISLAKSLLEPNSKVEKLLSASEKTIDRATSLTSQLLTFAKGGAPVTRIQKIDTIIKETAEFSLRGSRVKLHLDIEQNLWPVEVDRGQISQVISNLVINAKQAFADKGGNIFIRAENINNNHPGQISPLKADKLIKISVKDDGCGIPAHLFEKILDPYFTTKEMGNGLGLAMCHSIISRHDGLLTFTSEVNKGSVFVIELPVSTEQTIKMQDKPAEQHLNPDLNLTGAKILIMDDEPQICLLLQNILLRFKAIPTAVENGEKAVSKYQEALEQNQPYDLVIVDLTIPGGMGGQETAEKILELDPAAKIIVSSGYATDPVMAQYQDYGFKKSVIKPYKITNLKETLEQVLAS